MNWIGRKIHLYNVTIGLYMLDWWERYLFSILLPIASLAVVFPSPPLLKSVDSFSAWLSLVVFSWFCFARSEKDVRIYPGMYRV
jgi:hypothetical protein